MPEPYWPKRKTAFKLTDAERNGLLIHVRCPYDKRQRLYVVADLIKAFGDMPVDDLDQHFKCRCRSKLAIGTMVPTASERQSIKLCRLVDIVTVKHPVWQDDP